MLRKLMASQERDLKYSVLAMFYHPSRWTPKEIIAELDKRLPEETWNLVRRACSVLARGNVLNAFGHGVDKSYGTLFCSHPLFSSFDSFVVPFRARRSLTHPSDLRLDLLYRKRDSRYQFCDRSTGRGQSSVERCFVR